MEKNDNLRNAGREYGLTFSRDRSYLMAKKRIYKARKCPVYECLINPSWKGEGFANILLSRKQPDNNIIFGAYLVDTYCLGLKNTFCNVGFTLSEYEDELKAGIYRDNDPIDCPVSLIHQIIYGAIEYAANLGFKPQKDFNLSKYVLEKQSEIEESTPVEFGKDGKPFYVSGPYDNVDSIIEQLKEKLGEENFHFLIGEQI